MDIETINIDGSQLPICISLAYFYSESKLFLIDLTTTDLNKAVNKLSLRALGPYGMRRFF